VAAVWIGARSYAIYLWHVPLIYLVALHGLGPANVSRLVGPALIGVPLTFIAAALSYRWVEKPFLAMKDRLHRVRPTLAEPPGQPPVPEGSAELVAATRAPELAAATRSP
jgi:peptidoglycan/LPS O-acetylase OafA/YrhL